MRKEHFEFVCDHFGWTQLGRTCFVVFDSKACPSDLVAAHNEIRSKTTNTVVFRRPLRYTHTIDLHEVVKFIQETEILFL